MTRLFVIAAFAATLSTPALADSDLGAYLYRADCANLSRDAIIKDVGDLDRHHGGASEWARLGMSNATPPDPLWIEDEDTDVLRPDAMAQGGYALAIHADDDKDAKVIACGDLKGTAPFTADLAEIDRSGIAGRVAIEPHKDGIRLTTAAFKVGSAQ